LPEFGNLLPIERFPARRAVPLGPLWRRLAQSPKTRVRGEQAIVAHADVFAA
jgi:hypothetical protein